MLDSVMQSAATSSLACCSTLQQLVPTQGAQQEHYCLLTYSSLMLLPQTPKAVSILPTNTHTHAALRYASCWTRHARWSLAAPHKQVVTGGSCPSYDNRHKEMTAGHFRPTVMQGNMMCLQVGWRSSFPTHKDTYDERTCGPHKTDAPSYAAAPSAGASSSCTCSLPAMWSLYT